MGGNRAEETTGRPQRPPYHHYYNPDTNTDYVLLPPYYPSSRTRRIPGRICSIFTFVILPLALLSAALFLLWPSDPELKIVRLRLDHIGVSSKKFVSIDISMDLTVKVRNRDFFALDYRSVVVSIGYRGRQLGFVTSDGGLIKARGSSYVNATLLLNGIEVLHDVFYLLEDLARGSIPFDTVTDFQGLVRILFLDIPLQARISCEVYVNTNNQTVIRQDCYPE